MYEEGELNEGLWEGGLGFACFDGVTDDVLVKLVKENAAHGSLFAGWKIFTTSSPKSKISIITVIGISTSDPKTNPPKITYSDKFNAMHFHLFPKFHHPLGTGIVLNGLVEKIEEECGMSSWLHLNGGYFRVQIMLWMVFSGARCLTWTWFSIILRISIIMSISITTRANHQLE